MWMQAETRARPIMILIWSIREDCVIKEKCKAFARSDWHGRQRDRLVKGDYEENSKSVAFWWSLVRDGVAVRCVSLFAVVLETVLVK